MSKDQNFINFLFHLLQDVRIGYLEGPQASLDLDENNAQNTTSQQTSNTSVAIPIGNSQSQTPLNAISQNLSSSLQGVSNSASGTALSGSPPQSGRVSPPLQTPPSSASSQREGGFGVTPQQLVCESVELQVDYWPIVRPGDHISSKDKSNTRSGDQGGKNSIKSTFRSLQVWRLPQNAQLGEMSNGLTVSFATKEKKQKQSMNTHTHLKIYSIDFLNCLLFSLF